MSVGTSWVREKCRNDVISEEMRSRRTKKTVSLPLSPDKHSSFPFTTNLIKINHRLSFPPFTTQGKSNPTLDYSPVCGYVRHPFVITFCCRRSSTWVSHDCFFQSTSSSQRCSPSCGTSCYLCSCREKSLRTNPTLKFQQRREKIPQLWFTLMLFCSLSPPVIFHLNHSVIMWCTRTDTHWFIDWIMSPAVMFHSHVHSVIV